MVHGGINIYQIKYYATRTMCVRVAFLFMKVFQALIENIREEIFRVKWKVDFGNRGEQVRLDISL